MTNINIYSWLSHSMVHIPSPDDPNHICLFLCFVNREVAQSCPTLCYPMDCSLPGSSVHPWDFPDKSPGVGCQLNPWKIRLVAMSSQGRVLPTLS